MRRAAELRGETGDGVLGRGEPAIDLRWRTGGDRASPCGHTKGRAIDTIMIETAGKATHLRERVVSGRRERERVCVCVCVSTAERKRERLRTGDERASVQSRPQSQPNPELQK